jgi:hypothetical protein
MREKIDWAVPKFHEPRVLRGFNCANPHLTREILLERRTKEWTSRDFTAEFSAVSPLTTTKVAKQLKSLIKICCNHVNLVNAVDDELPLFALFD